jgi:hypothetical protein
MRLTASFIGRNFSETIQIVIEEGLERAQFARPYRRGTEVQWVNITPCDENAPQRFSLRRARPILRGRNESAHTFDGGTYGGNIRPHVLTIRSLAGESAGCSKAQVCSFTVGRFKSYGAHALDEEIS